MPFSRIALPSQLNFTASNCALQFLAIEQRRGRDAAVEQRDGGTVLRRDVVEEIGGTDAAAARHIVDEDIGIARQVLAHIAREQARIGVVAAARRAAGDEVHFLAAAEEFLRGLLLRRRRRRRRRARARRRRPRCRG